jgi:hypothetical protein
MYSYGTVGSSTEFNYNLHNLDLESHGGAHCVAPEATSVVKALAEAKFHMY